MVRETVKLYPLSTEIGAGSISITTNHVLSDLNDNQTRDFKMYSNKQGTPVLVYKPYTYKSSCFIIILIPYKNNYNHKSIINITTMLSVPIINMIVQTKS